MRRCERKSGKGGMLLLRLDALLVVGRREKDRGRGRCRVRGRGRGERLGRNMGGCLSLGRFLLRLMGGGLRNWRDSGRANVSGMWTASVTNVKERGSERGKVKRNGLLLLSVFVPSGLKVLGLLVPCIITTIRCLIIFKVFRPLVLLRKDNNNKC